MEQKLELNQNDYNKILFCVKRTIQLVSKEDLPYEYEKKDFKELLKKLSLK